MSEMIISPVVIVIDPQPLVHAGVEMLVSRQSGLQFGGGASDWMRGVALIREVHPAVAIFGLLPPLRPAFMQLQDLRKHFPKVGIVILSHVDEAGLQEQCIKLGVSEFLAATCTLEKLGMAIADASSYEAPLAAAPAFAIDAKWSEPHHQHLSKAEFQVFGMLGRRMTVRQIAAEIGVSQRTIETYRFRMRKKLGLSSSLELTELAAKGALAGNGEHLNHRIQEEEVPNDRIA